MGDPVFKIPGIISVQHIQERMDYIRVNLLTDETFKEESIEPLKANYLRYLGEQMTIDVHIVDRLEERGTGKRPVIISRLDKTGMKRI